MLYRPSVIEPKRRLLPSVLALSLAERQNIRLGLLKSG